MRRRQEARAGETDTIAVKIKKGNEELKKKRAVVGEQATSQCDRYKTQTAEEEREQEGTVKVADDVISTVERICSLERD